MFLIAILIAIAGLQIWGAANPLHKDAWFERWSGVVSAMSGLDSVPKVKLAICLLVPVLITAMISCYLRETWFLWVLFAAAILLYSLGRGRFMELFLNYLEAVRVRSWERAVRHSQALGVSVQDINSNEWAVLNTRVLSCVVYRAFERLFAVLFWFLLFGPAGALLYRLSHILKQRDLTPAELQEAEFEQTASQQGRDLARWMWALEWPAARVFALSFAVTGNFVGCLEGIKHLFVSVEDATAKVLYESALGSLSLDSHDSVVDVGVNELDSMHKLLNRTLWLWVLVLALISFF